MKSVSYCRDFDTCLLAATTTQKHCHHYCAHVLTCGGNINYGLAEVAARCPVEERLCNPDGSQKAVWTTAAN